MVNDGKPPGGMINKCGAFPVVCGDSATEWDVSMLCLKAMQDTVGLIHASPKGDAGQGGTYV